MHFFKKYLKDVRYIPTLWSLYGYQMLSSDPNYSEISLSLIAMGRCSFPPRTNEIRGA